MANNMETSITIDGVVVSSNKNLYDLLGVKPEGLTAEVVERKANEKIGHIIFAYIKASKNLDADLTTAGLSDYEKEEVKSVYRAYKVLNNSNIKAAYDSSRKIPGANIQITLDGEIIDLSEDFYATLGITEEDLQDDATKTIVLGNALKIKLGEIFANLQDQDTFMNGFSDSDKNKIKDFQGAAKILGNDSNRMAYDIWMAAIKNQGTVNPENKQPANSNDKRGTKVKGVEDGTKPSKQGHEFLKGVGVGLLAVIIIAGLMFGGYKLISSFNNNGDNPGIESNDPDYNPSQSTVIDENAFVDANNVEQVKKRAEAQLAALKDNGIIFRVPDGNGADREVNAADLESLIYWCNYSYLNGDNKAKAANMDTAANLVAQICANMDMVGFTSQRVAGISDIPDDSRMGSYDFDLGSFFLDGTIQQQVLSGLSEDYNTIKNNPERAHEISSEIFRDAIEHFTFEDSSMSLDNEEFDTANFIYGMFLAANQTFFDAKPSFEKDGATYDNYGALTDQLNATDGAINMLGRDIDKKMNDNLTLNLDGCN